MTDDPNGPWRDLRAPPDLLDRALREVGARRERETREARDRREAAGTRVRPSSPSWGLLAAVALGGVLLGWGISFPSAPELAPSPPEAPSFVSAEPGARPVVLDFRAEPGHRVEVAASWNAWQAEASPMREVEPGVYRVVVPLIPGEYEYMFLVDGERWVTDETAARHREDDFGQRNAVLAF